MDSSPGTKPQDRPSSSPVSQSQLLPPLELSSSPGLPNASSRRLSRPGSSAKAPAATSSHAYLKYPTPLPTSSTGILSSSPPRINTRPPLQRVPSTVSERAPLSAVPSIELNENGDTVLMGRSSNSSHYQLSANRLISRVHVKARYIPATVPLEPNKIEIECNGWNGLKLHCQGRTHDLHKGDVLSFETEGAEIMLDVQDARVLVHWPKRDARDSLADLGWEDSPRSVRNGISPIAGLNPRAGSGVDLGLLQSSPLRRATRIASPESPTPAHASLQHALSDGVPSSSQHSSILSDLPSSIDRDKSVEIYEDEDADDQGSSVKDGSIGNQSFIDVNKSFSSDLSDVNSDEDDENNPNEENDPIIHSFGPYGSNLNSRMSMTSFHVESPKRRRLDSGYAAASPRDNAASRALFAAADISNSRRSSKSGSTPRQESIGRKVSPTPVPEEIVPDLSHVDVATITNHIANQLAFSRLSSTPLSTIMANLPTEEKKGLRREELKYIVESTTCIGTIERHGKDAEGKPLESQYYYVPEKDNDEHRRAAVVDGLRKPTLRNCRKHHVQYYWKRPRTP
ncbi:Protein PLM2 [Cytospora mali]|uniref:Protein PLM2 n=1 Tax=Cytospora mali TaxID=578113 RepID=A0A194UQH5_CYTMA|nr:Protein PLM2 [Valsa mali var. pyri (nom. inval.)]